MSFLKALASIGLQWRILLSVAVGLGIALSGFAFISLHYLDESTDRTLSEQLAISQVTANHVDGLLARIEWQLEGVAAHIPEAGGGTRLPAEASFATVRDLVSRVVVVDADGRLVAEFPAEGNTGADYSGRLYLQRALETQQSAVATAFGAGVNGGPGIGIAVPYRNSSGRLSGVLGAEIDFQQRGVEEFLQPVKVGKTGYLQLIDENGLVLASTEPVAERDADRGGTFTSHPEHFPSLIKRGQPTVEVCHTCHQVPNGLERGRDMIAFAPLSTAPFGVVLRLSEDEVLAPRNNLRWTLAAYSLIVLLLGLLFAWLTTNAVVRPLEGLTTAARRIGGGDLGSPVRLTGGSGTTETTTLAATLEAMRRRLGASYERIERLNRGLEERVAQRTRELSILFDVSQTLTRTVEVDALMQMVVEKIVSVVDAADGALLFQYNPKEQVLVPRAAVGYHPEPLREVRLTAGEAMAGKVLDSGRPHLFENEEQVRLALTSASTANAEHLRRAREGLAQPSAALAAPILYQGEVAGVLLLVNLRHRGASFDPSDVALVQALADQVAVAIEHARVVQEASQVQALREADRLKSEFLMNVSHELRTPLSSIVSLVEVLAADYKTIPRRQLGQLLAIIERSGARLKDMVENLLDAGSIQAGRFKVQKQPELLPEIVQDALGCVRPLLEDKGQVVEVDLAIGDSVIMADRNRIAQVLVNLLSNANKYCANGQRFHLRATRTDDVVLVSLDDSGPGISEDDQAHLFERFYRSARPLSATGAGLGLPIAKGIVEAHGGSLWLESRVGYGTTVSFTIPLAVDGEDDAGDTAAGKPAMQGVG